jgi:hypothetical protein
MARTQGWSSTDANNFTPFGFGFKKGIRDLTDEEYDLYIEKVKKAAERQRKVSEALVPTRGISNVENPDFTNSYGKDWSTQNPNYSWDNMQTMAKSMAELQLEQSSKLMDLSYGYRTREKEFDSGIRERDDNRRFGFDKYLENLRNTQQLELQQRQYGQEQAMFRKQREADRESTASARRAANNLFYGNRVQY